MNRFIWLVRRELWEHKAIWIAPAVVLGCILLLMLIGKLHLAPYDDLAEHAMPALTAAQKTTILTYAYAALALPMFLVMGIIAFFYALDALYADRRDRSVLFWKSLPLSDAETVLSKFTTAIVLIPLVALAATVVMQLMVLAGDSLQGGFAGMPAGFMWDPQAIVAGIGVAALWCVTAMLWYAPFVGYLMLASAWAPRAPFLWAVLPPAALWILEAVVMRSEVIGGFITDRLFVMPTMLRLHAETMGTTIEQAASKIERATSLDLYALLGAFYGSKELWLGVLAAALLLAAAMWVRRYRDETA
jgi:ABC-2 type transport system permease protein